MVGEGGNLGFTQRGRIEYAMAGGRINTDAIDNSAGVDCSDHEVNLKILLSLPIGAGELTMDDRNVLLQAVAGDVTKHVLYDNYLQVQILSQEQAVSHLRMEHYEDLMTELEASGMLDRELESLPSSEAMAERQRNGRGLVRPELCVLLAYAKRLLREQVTASTLPDDDYLHSDLAAYFPPAVTERFGAYVATHPLRREMIATIVTNDVINSMGITFVPRMAAETGASPDEVARAFIAAREVSVARDRWDDIEGLDGVVPGDVQAGMMTGVDTMVEQLARWYLQHVPDLAIGAEVAATGPAFAELVANLETAATAPGARHTTSGWPTCGRTASPSGQHGSRRWCPTWSTRRTSSPCPGRAAGRSATSPTHSSWSASVSTWTPSRTGWRGCRPRPGGSGWRGRRSSTICGCSAARSCSG